MKITVLVDNNTLIDRYFYGEPGVSYYIEDEGKTILFDVGYSDAFLRNAQKMNISFHTLDFLVLSHGHLDHTWGLDHLVKFYSEASNEKQSIRKPRIVAHPLVFKSKIFDGEEIGTLISEEKISQHFKLELSMKPVWISEQLVYLGEIPRTNDYENKRSIGMVVYEDNQEQDYLKDDSALVYKSKNGLIIITGCSHSGICNIIDYAKKVCHEEKVADVIGGFHLLNPDKNVLEKTIDYFSYLKPGTTHPCHCTDLKTKIALSNIVPVEEVGVGMTLQYA